MNSASADLANLKWKIFENKRKKEKEKKRKKSRKFQRAKLQFAMCWQLFT